MAAPLSHDRLIAILKAEGIRVAEYPGWRDRERDDETGKAFGPVNLVLNHHTVSRDSLRIVAETGYAGLPGPLAHIHLAKSGLATMCSGGRANHAGLMAKNAFDSFFNEEAVHPKPDKTTGTVDGNDCSYGIEAENLGDNVDVWTRSQYDALVRINAAFCRQYGWKGDSCAGHKETSVEGKIDPRGPVEGYGTRGRFDFTMDQLRKDVNERLAHAASWSPGTTPPAPTPTVEERLTALEKTVKDQGARLAVLESKGA
ncbi:peptidoglycan recognition protein family protein [Streptomyces europaeiscabiei]|uniref:peptidoglycan recognition protein family protein n=1 Tax=Streptomyces europaeiscabiei TaxID=146819 RepID=UPI0029AF34DA|nr:N-acetylmuramoyl-L-alanine amidase [Streptomyces europaeiscabiei]MDX2767043.1 N-acetylmuramoyl-L-alanine amidase [Streptomyces europaeiscabiei]